MNCDSVFIEYANSKREGEGSVKCTGSHRSHASRKFLLTHRSSRPFLRDCPQTPPKLCLHAISSSVSPYLSWLKPSTTVIADLSLYLVYFVINYAVYEYFLLIYHTLFLTCPRLIYGSWNLLC